MLMIRFQRIGRTNDPAFRIVVLEKERSPKAGNPLAVVGTYNPKTKAVTLKGDEIKGWIAKGAQVSPSLHNLLLAKGVLEGKKINVLPKKTYTAPVVEAPAPEPVAEAASEAAPEAVAEEVAAEPTEAEVVAEAVEDAAPEVAEAAAVEAPAVEEAATEPAAEEAPAA
jgi:small subunit ribosomal protein S16